MLAVKYGHILTSLAQNLDFSRLDEWGKMNTFTQMHITVFLNSLLLSLGILRTYNLLPLYI